MQEELFRQLLEKYITNSITATERQQFYYLLKKPAFQQLLQEKIDTELITGGFNNEEDVNLRELIFERIQQKKNKPEIPVRQMFSWKRFAVAASILIMLGFGYYQFIYHKQVNDGLTISENPPIDAKPGNYKAKLTLVDGSTIILDSAAVGKLAKQGNTFVIHKNGQLMYDASEQDRNVMYNTVSTSNGETFSLKMADGSTVFLNSASSVNFPVSFPGAERRVEITGEVYFSVAKNANQPFIVSVNGMEVQALGTEFNINAYIDEATMKTTLVEGSVKVSSPANQQSVIIKPGQQTHSNGKNLSVINDVNIDEVIAWKEGLFHLESTDLKMLLRQFARWYDVEIVYEGEMPQDKFFVIVSRKSSLSSVLKMLKAHEINFRIEGKKLFVQPR
ncbi:MAG: FecR domain-containing protein [Chitinophagaceae bacterium]|nr:FecR domain-containing protein [Chitinophagaceae bacterium]